MLIVMSTEIKGRIFYLGIHLGIFLCSSKKEIIRKLSVNIYFYRNLLTVKAGLLLRNDKKSEKIFNDIYRYSFEAFKVCNKELFKCMEISALLSSIWTFF